MKLAASLLLAASVLAGCGGKPPPPDWKLNAVGLIEDSQRRWLEGDSAGAERALALARSEIARTGRVDLIARAELAACAARVASLDFEACHGYRKLAADADAGDVVYARFIGGAWTGADAGALPAHYADLVRAGDDAAANRAARAIKEPLPRLIAIALLFQNTRAEPASLASALDTASERGWRRPLLAWLKVELARARAAGDEAAAGQLQRRIDLALEEPPKR